VNRRAAKDCCGTTAGLLYEHSVRAVIGFSIVVQLASLPLFIAAERMRRREGKTN
jgi:hypothetical protein